MTGDIRATRSGSTGRITLDRPAKLNALTPPMVREIDALLAAWAGDPAIATVLLEGAGPRAFCAGGDVAFVHASARAGDGTAERFWAEEYRLNARIARYPKPLVALMTGIVMGGGVGLAAHANRRIVTGDTALAMPEVRIGLIPDVGGTWLLSHAPGECGTYLALTGRTIGAADVLALGLADAYVPAARLPDFTAALARGDGDCDATIARFAGAPGEAPLVAQRPAIDAAFAHDSVSAIRVALDADGSAFARAAAADLDANSPTSLTVTLRTLREARRMASLEEALALEYRLMCRIAGSHDFFEGIRAAVIDKDRHPAWCPARLADVDPTEIDRMFSSLATA
jgi:enoyl-CoA hydratase